VQGDKLLCGHVPDPLGVMEDLI